MTPPTAVTFQSGRNSQVWLLESTKYVRNVVPASRVRSESSASLNAAAGKSPCTEQSPLRPHAKKSRMVPSRVAETRPKRRVGYLCRMKSRSATMPPPLDCARQAVQSAGSVASRFQSVRHCC